VNWAGFYVRDDKFPTLASPVQSPPVLGGQVTISTTYASMDGEQTLLLGPFHGKPACQLIKFGKGVCGTAAAKQETVVVPDVEKFPGHIACDAESRSEIVVPIIVNGQVCVWRESWGAETCADTTPFRPSPLSTLTALNPLASTTRIRSTLRNWRGS
jgi:GAF domain-containing protein